MGKVTRKEMPLWARTGHGKPVSRRDFLAHGIIPFAASALVPGALGLLTGIPEAMADALSCPSNGGTMASFITLNLSGGAALMANFIPRDKGGQLLPSYSKMGNGTAPPIETEFGVPAFAGRTNAADPNTVISKMLLGIRSTATAATLNNTAFLGACVQSRDDSGANTFDASGMVFKAGVTGSRLPNLGTSSTITGLNQMAATVSPPPPLVVKSFTDLANSIGYTSAIKNSLSADQRVSLTKLTQNLSASQTRKLASINTLAQVKTLVDCAGIKNADLVQQGSAAVDPFVNAPTLAAVWGINAGTAANSQGRVFGSMVYNALAGNAGTVNLEMGGYDYHDNSRTTGDKKDQQAGAVIGQILESARVMGKPAFVYVTSDGAVVSSESATGGTPWVSDRGTAGAALIFMYSPNGRPATRAQQIGNYVAGQVADDTHPIGANPEAAAQAVFANYLQFNRAMSLFAAIAPRGLSGAALTEVIKIV